MIRVLHTIRQGKIGGGERHVLDLVKYLDTREVHSSVLAFTDGPMVNQLRQAQIPVYVLPTEKPFDLRVWKQVKALMRNERINILHAHGTRAASNCLWAARSLGLPSVYTIHGWSFHPDQSPLTFRVRRLAERWITHFATCNISVSDANQQLGRHYWNFRSVRVDYGVDMQRFDPDLSAAAVRQAYGVAPDELLVGYIVRITKQKDPITMLKGFHQAAQAFPKLRLLVVGDGKLKADMVAKAQQLGIDERIIFDGFREDIPDVLQAVDIYCLPSLWEGLPIGLLEAMSMGKAIVATAVDGTPEAIEPGHNGLLMQPGDHENLARHLLALANNPDLRRKMGQQAHQTIRNRFDAATTAQNVAALYKKILGLATDHPTYLNQSGLG